MTYLCGYDSPIGPMTMASDGVALTGLWFDGQKYDQATVTGEVQVVVLERLEEQKFEKTTAKTDLHEAPLEQEIPPKEVTGTAVAGPAMSLFHKTATWLDQYFSGEVPTVEVLLKIEGSDFKKAVTDVMRSIPYGETMTYGDIAKVVAAKMGREHMSAQAIGGAVGHNAISLIIPCHRVLGSNGALTGYAGGTDRKSYLLNLEASTSK